MTTTCRTPASAAGVALAQGVGGGVGPADCRARRRKRLAAEEEAAEDGHRVAEVQRPVIVGVRGIVAGDGRPGQIELAEEKRGRGRGPACLSPCRGSTPPSTPFISNALMSAQGGMR